MHLWPRAQEVAHQGGEGGGGVLGEKRGLIEEGRDFFLPVKK